MSDEDGAIVNLCAVPEGCIADMIAFTTPRDACCFAIVSKAFRSASDSDVVWERFLPPDCEAIVSRSDSGQELLAEIQSKKQLYMRLANCPLLVDGATKSFWLEKSSGMKCWMLSARSLSIIWSCTPRYWQWTPNPESRFSEVAELNGVCWLEISGTIKSSMLSPQMRYAPYLVFKMARTYGFDNLAVQTSVNTLGDKTNSQNAYLIPDSEPLQTARAPTPRETRGFPMIRRLINEPSQARECRIEGAQYPTTRTDGWQELKIGEFLTGVGEDGEVEFSLMEVKAGTWKGGLVVQGIEVRPVGTSH